MICTRAGEWISDFLKKNDGVTIEITESNTYSLQNAFSYAALSPEELL